MRKYAHIVGLTNNTTSQVLHNGVFKISKAYTLLRGETVKVDWRNLVCNNCAESKQVFILWLQLHGRLRTKDVLLRWGMAINATCPLCNSVPESAAHLFFECIFAKTTWEVVLN